MTKDQEFLEAYSENSEMYKIEIFAKNIKYWIYYLFSRKVLP